MKPTHKTYQCPAAILWPRHGADGRDFDDIDEICEQLWGMIFVEKDAKWRRRYKK